MTNPQSNDIRFVKVEDPTNLKALIDNWRDTLTAPQDGMWEAFMNYANQYEISHGETIGYAAIDDENKLLQFYLEPSSLDLGVTALEGFISQFEVKKAMVGTNNPIFLSLALNLQKSTKVDTYLFTDAMTSPVAEKEGELNTATQQDLQRLVDFCHVSMGGPKDWLTGYLGNLINRGELFVLENAGETLGTCEVRKSDSQPGVADVGMIVSADHRREGLGTFLLGKAKEIALKWDLKPICSCEKDNVGSLKSIHKNGFRSMHQMLLMEF